MKTKTVAITIIAVTALVALPSCKKNKCKECHYDKNGAEVELGEYCGDDLEMIEQNGTTVNDTLYEVHCGEH